MNVRPSIGRERRLVRVDVTRKRSFDDHIALMCVSLHLLCAFRSHQQCTEITQSFLTQSLFRAQSTASSFFIEPTRLPKQLKETRMKCALRHGLGVRDERHAPCR